MKYRNINLHTLSISHFPYSALTERPTQYEIKQRPGDFYQPEHSSRGFSYISPANGEIISHQTKMTTKNSVKKLFRGTIVDHFYALFTAPVK